MAHSQRGSRQVEMLPDFANEKAHMMRLLRAVLDDARRAASPVVGQMREIAVHEGRFTRHVDQFGRATGSPLREFRESLSMTDEECKSASFDDLMHRAASMGRSMAEKQERAFFCEVQKATMEAGTQLDARGKRFDPSMLLDAIDRMNIEFDDWGQPRMPSAYVSPEMAAYLRDNALDWEAVRELRRRYFDLIARKRREWRAREADRRLVD